MRVVGKSNRRHARRRIRQVAAWEPLRRSARRSGSELNFCGCRNDLDGYAVGYAVLTLMSQLSGKSKEPLWHQSRTRDEFISRTAAKLWCASRPGQLVHSRRGWGHHPARLWARDSRRQASRSARPSRAAGLTPPAARLRRRLC